MAEQNPDKQVPDDAESAADAEGVASSGSQPADEAADPLNEEMPAEQDDSSGESIAEEQSGVASTEGESPEVEGETDELAAAALAAAQEAISQLGEEADTVSSVADSGDTADSMSDMGRIIGDPPPLGGMPSPIDLPDLGDANINGKPEGIDLLADVNLNVKIELGRTLMLVEDVLRLNDGSIIELDKLAGDPVDVFVNDRHVARGEVLVLNDTFCVRISEVLSPVSADTSG